MSIAHPPSEPITGDSENSSKPGKFAIVLRKSSDFTHLDDAMNTIFDSFSLLSWLTPSCQIRIHRISFKKER